MTQEINRNDEESAKQQRLLDNIFTNCLGKYPDYLNNQSDDNDIDKEGLEERKYLLKTAANREHLARCIRDYVNGDLVKVLVDESMLIDFTESANQDHTHFKSRNKELVEKFNKRVQQIKGNIPFDEDNKPVPLMVKRVKCGGFKSIAIEDIHRLVFKVVENRLIIVSCYYHTI
ncbi:transcriptional regulator [Staphylococcus carnosus]|uniref:type II toxin-antitoxin system YoeB family toxin n=1 Tax=Staphylococcus carnosus TaxID=1281 RepID=UPI0006ABD277|nr:type II toxin-antitoxin system YoeB family toxin [Staphylococcus carnosus]KOR13788.1 transcriptional regulator [Staphylococcus carnosus]